VRNSLKKSHECGKKLIHLEVQVTEEDYARSGTLVSIVLPVELHSHAGQPARDTIRQLPFLLIVKRQVHRRYLQARHISPCGAARLQLQRRSTTSGHQHAFISSLQARQTCLSYQFFDIFCTRLVHYSRREGGVHATCYMHCKHSSRLTGCFFQFDECTAEGEEGLHLARWRLAVARVASSCAALWGLHQGPRAAALQALGRRAPHTAAWDSSAPPTAPARYSNA
jgi:hypothetical protein